MFDFLLTQTTENPWQEVARSFADTKGRQPTEDLIFLTLALALLLLLVSWTWKYFASRQTRPWASGIFTTPTKIAHIIDQAMLWRSRFDMGFYPTDTTRPSIPCSLTEYSDTDMTLEVPLGVTPSTRWIGRSMICYFYILHENKPPVFYKFISTVSNVFTKGTFQYVVLHTPTTITLEQKRKHLRLEIQPEVIKDFRLWIAKEDSTFHFETDRNMWPEEFAIYDSAQGNRLRIVDISGGGIALLINPKYYPDLDMFTAYDQILFMHLTLRPVDNMSLPPYFLAARLRTKIKEFDTGMMRLGYEFVEYSLDQEEQALEWIKIDPPKGIEDLITWTFKRHLELYRQQKIE